MRALGPAAALLLFAGVASAEERDAPIEPRGPSFTTGTATIRPGFLQIEAGVAYARTGETGGAQRRFSVEATARTGLTERVELRLDAEPFVRLRGQDEATGSGDYALGVVWRFNEAPDDSFVPSLGALSFVKLPAASEPIGTERPDFGALLLASFSLPADFAMEINAGLAAIGQTRPGGYLLQALVGASFGVIIEKAWVPFVSLGYASRDQREGRDRLSAQAGVIWRITNDLGMDLSLEASLLGRAPDYAPRLGLSTRFGR